MEHIFKLIAIGVLIAVFSAVIKTISIAIRSRKK